MTSRRSFLGCAVSGSTLLGLIPTHIAHTQVPQSDMPPELKPLTLPAEDKRLDLSPAQWIWYPSARTLPNTVVLFRRSFRVGSAVKKAAGWIAADSRYLLTIDGKRVQWGPAPSDPRRMEVDPIDLARLLTPGEHTLGVTVLFYGHGDGTHPIGKPGLIFTLSAIYADGSELTLHSDPSWSAFLCRSWRPGQYKRWYIRSFQEDFDSRLYPYGWDSPSFVPTPDWLPAQVLDCPATVPSAASRYPDYLMETTAERGVSCLVPRSIPMLTEHPVAVERLAEAFTVRWHRPAEEYFDVLPPNAFSASPLAVPSAAEGAWTVELDGKDAIALTFAFRDQSIGFPFFTIDAPRGTIVELMVQEGHTPGGPPLLNTHFHSWSRFTSSGGRQSFQTFDYEACKWLQLHIHGAAGRVTVSEVGLLRRVYPWPNVPKATVGEPALQRLMDASINTLHNSAQETAVDGMGRERQQYSGDGSHQLHAVQLTFGERRLPARFLSTFSQGLMLEGYFFDCWPAYDRLARIMERQINMTIWGPLLDHSIGFGFDIFHYYMYSGDLDAVREPSIRYQRFVRYLHRIRTADGLLPVTNLGTPAVWIDHYAYRGGRQEHKQCAFNLYAAAMLRHAFAPLAHALGDHEWGEFAEALGTGIEKAAVRQFWSKQDGLFVNNLPWLPDEHQPRMCDRSLATALLFDQCPDGNTGPVLEALVSPPAHMGVSYPANACWRYWALSRGGRTDVVLQDLRKRWATMDSVLQNNAIGENWNALPDGGDLWSHCAVVPLYLLTMGIAGIQPTAPGFARCQLRPQPADLPHFEVVVPTVRGPIAMECKGRMGDRTLRVQVPETCDAELVLDAREQVTLVRTHLSADGRTAHYALPPQKDHRFHLVHT
jgi:hypothetical protein